MKQIVQDYFAAVKAWDAKHRLVGQTPIEKLIAESEEALLEFKNSARPSTCLVDIGAGAGILGFPWLCLAKDHITVFVEPDKKKASFLRDLFANKVPEMGSRVLILADLIENVSRGTLESFAPRGYFCVARAFSGAKTLEESFTASELRSESLYIFDIFKGGLTPNKKFVIRQVPL